MSLGSYDSPTFLGQKDKYLLGLSLPELMVAICIGGFWFFLMFAFPLGMMARLLLVIPLTGVSMLFLFVRIAGLPVPKYLLLSILRLFRRPSYEERQELVLDAEPAWLERLELQRENKARRSRFFGLLQKGRRAATVSETTQAEIRAEMDRQAVEAAISAESWARDAIRTLSRGR